MITSTASCLRWHRLTAELRNAATESVAETMRTLSSPALSEGADTPTISPMIATTTTNSSRVMPRRARTLLAPANNIGIKPFAAGLPIAAQADDVWFVIAVLAGILVD